MKQHGIGWLNWPDRTPETLDPIFGCSKVSPGCKNCWAERVAARITACQYGCEAHNADIYYDPPEVADRGVVITWQVGDEYGHGVGNTLAEAVANAKETDA